jgi:hypothetical protein
MVYRYDVRIFVTNKDHRSCSAIRILGSYKKNRQTRVVMTGFGHSGLQDALNKTFNILSAHLLNKGDVFVEVNTPIDEDLVQQLMVGHNRVECRVTDTIDLEPFAIRMADVENSVWEDTDIIKNS